MTDRLIVIGWFVFATVTGALFFVIALILRIITSPFDRRLKILQQFTCFWAFLYTRVVPGWHIRIEGRHNIRRNATYVVVSNHQSLLDIMVLYNLFFHFKFVSKAEIFRIPFIGWNMTLNRYIRLKRGDRESIARMMADAERTLAEGSSVMIFPEGTRSPDGQIKSFKPGAFILAQKMGVPILPIVISGTSSALPKYKFSYKGPHDILLRVLEEIPVERFSGMTTEALSDMVRGIMIHELAEMAPGKGLETLNDTKKAA